MPYTVIKTNEAHIMMQQQPINPLDTAKSWRRIIDKVFHLFGNKLFSLRSINNLLRKTLPSLLKGYQLAVENQLMKPELDQKLLDSMSNHVRMEDSLNTMIQTMDAVQSACKALCTTDQATGQISVATVIKHLLNSTDDRITFDESNSFNTDVPELFLRSILLHYIHFSQSHFKDPNRTITIYCSKQSEQVAVLHFKVISTDAKANYDYFFENSFILLDETMLPSIEFCRLALFYTGGTVSYEVHEQQDVEFIIELPISI